MFDSGPNYSKLKTNLRLAVNRLKLLEKKNTELALKARKEIADYIAAGKAERGKQFSFRLKLKSRKLITFVMVL